VSVTADRVTVGLQAKTAAAAVIFIALEVALFETPTLYQSILWIVFLRGVPFVSAPLAIVGAGVWARDQGVAKYVRAVLWLLIFFDTVEFLIVLFYDWG